MRPERLERIKVVHVVQDSPATGAEEIACTVRREKQGSFRVGCNGQIKAAYLLPPLVSTWPIPSSSDERAHIATEDQDKASWVPAPAHQH